MRARVSKEEHIRTVKLAFPWCFLILVPSLALAGGTGHLLGHGRTGRLVEHKRRRMPFIAANGIVILIPCALFLAWKADSYAFDATFYAVQVLELAAGALNLALLGMNLRNESSRRASADGPACRLTTPLQFTEHLNRTFEAGFRMGQKPIPADIVAPLFVMVSALVTGDGHDRDAAAGGEGGLDGQGRGLAEKTVFPELRLTRPLSPGPATQFACMKS